MKTTLKIFLIFLIMIFVFILISKHLNNINDNTTVIEKIDKKQTFNLLFYEQENKEDREYFEYYKDVYDLDFIEFKVDKTKKDYINILRKLNLEENLINNPSFISVEKGIVKSLFININNEMAFKKYLKQHKILKSKFINNDNYILDEELKNDFEKEKNINVLYSIKSRDFYAMRKELLNSNIPFYIIVKDDPMSLKSEKQLLDKIPDLTESSIIEIKNGKIKNIIKNINRHNIKEKVEKKSEGLIK